MNKDELLVGLRNSGIALDAHAAAWRESIDLMAALEAIGRSGGSADVKIDGVRVNSAIYTVALPTGRMGDNSFRKHRPNLNTLLVDAISFLMKHAAR